MSNKDINFSLSSQERQRKWRNGSLLLHLKPTDYNYCLKHVFNQTQKQSKLLTCRDTCLEVKEENSFRTVFSYKHMAFDFFQLLQIYTYSFLYTHTYIYAHIYKTNTQLKHPVNLYSVCLDWKLRGHADSQQFKYREFHFAKFCQKENK